MLIYAAGIFATFVFILAESARVGKRPHPLGLVLGPLCWPVFLPFYLLNVTLGRLP